MLLNFMTIFGMMLALSSQRKEETLTAVCQSRMSKLSSTQASQHFQAIRVTTVNTMGCYSKIQQTQVEKTRQMKYSFETPCPSAKFYGVSPKNKV